MPPGAEQGTLDFSTLPTTGPERRIYRLTLGDGTTMLVTAYSRQEAIEIGEVRRSDEWVIRAEEC